MDSNLWMKSPAICDLASRRQWVCWKHQKRKGKLTKIPYQPNGKPASTTDPKTWSEMPTCFTEVVGGKFDGLGYVLTPDDGLVCTDLDHCIKEDGTLEPWAEEIVNRINSYTEVSPGGDGLHIWSKANVSFRGRRHKHVEVYASGRYMTVTANPWPGTPEKLEERTDAIEKLVADFHVEPKPTVSNGASITIDPKAEPPSLKFAALMTNDSRFKRSWDHTRSDLSDQSMSSYDMSQATIAAYAEWTDQEIADLIIAHRRESGNPEKALRIDYLERTIKRARQATAVNLKDYEAAEVHRTGETREVGVQEGLMEISTLLALDVRRVVQRGRNPAEYLVETEGHGEIHIGSAEILLSATKARAKLIASSEIYIPKMKAREWERVVALIVQIHEYEELAEGQRGTEMATWMGGYLSEHPPDEPENPQALATLLKTESWPIIWEEKIQVRTRDLKRYIFTALGEKVSTFDVCARLRGDGWAPDRLQPKVGDERPQARAWSKKISEIAED